MGFHAAGGVEMKEGRGGGRFLCEDPVRSGLFAEVPTTYLMTRDDAVLFFFPRGRLGRRVLMLILRALGHAWRDGRCGCEGGWSVLCMGQLLWLAC